MLRIEKINAGYKKNQILHNLSMSIEDGEIISIIGPNGSGKSTVLKSIFNLTDIYSGNIFFNNKDITKIPTNKLILEGISYVPQGKQIFPNLTVLENLEIGASIFKNKFLAKNNVLEILKQFPILNEQKNNYACNLSGGQQQLLAIARAIIQKPKLLLLDEPSLGLSPKMIKEVFKIIKNITKKGISVLLVEQNVKEAVEIADLTYVLESGNIALIGGKGILTDKKIENIYFGK